jgi:hypothetical protein
MNNYIFLIHSAHDFDFFIHLSKRKNPILIITTSIMYNAVKYNFPNTNILKIFYFDLSKEKIKKKKLLLKNISKLTMNFLLIFYKFFVIKKRFNKIVLVFNHIYAMHIMQALGISAMFKFKIIRKIIQNSQSHKDQAVSFNDKNMKIYEFFIFNKIISFKTFLKNDIQFTSDIKYKTIFSIKKKLNDVHEFIKKKYNSLINKKAIIFFDCPIGRMEDDLKHLYKIDQKKTSDNLRFFFKKKIEEGYLIYFKKRPDNYYFDGLYFCDLIPDINIHEINRFIPAEYLIKYFKYNYSVFSYSLKVMPNKKSNDLSHMIQKIKL